MPGSVNGMQFIIQNLEVIETFVVNIKENQPFQYELI
jgi:hypothetical protein